ncbi:MAG: outer membrane lipoprotein-sorting protein [Candidatus Krumholzibacteria bacterium]|nr:outer membrane lipoprotein-sorting protein [Candidatus Krumholzibacteria bacterium]
MWSFLIATVLLPLPLAVSTWAQESRPPDASRPSGRAVLERIDENLVLDSATGVSEMIIHGRSGTRSIRSRFWKQGADSSFVEYLSPPREAGKKMLKLGDMLWTYAPEPADRIITISGHLLRQSVMGSDLSYEDLLENSRLIEVYDAEVTGEEPVGGRPCWVVRMTSRVDDAAYHSRTVWVDKERWLPLREERYARSGRLLKKTTIEEAQRIGERWYISRATFRDMLSSGEGTEYIVESIEFGAEIPGHIFSKAALRQ